MDKKPIPCPFCGGSATLCLDADGTKKLRALACVVVCRLCGAQTGPCVNASQAIDAWNRRTDGIDPTRLAELKEAELEGRVRILRKKT